MITPRLTPIDSTTSPSSTRTGGTAEPNPTDTVSDTEPQEPKPTETVEAMERLVAEGKIRRWGVSNLDTDDMQALWRTAGGERCATNQVLYHLASRGIEYDLLPWCQQHTLPVMAYCPLAQAGRLRDGLFQHTDIIKMANERGVTVAQLLLAWVIRHPGMLAIPKAASIEHVVQNAAALDLVLSPQELAQLDRLYPPPPRKTRLDMV